MDKKTKKALQDRANTGNYEDILRIMSYERGEIKEKASKLLELIKNPEIGKAELEKILYQLYEWGGKEDYFFSQASKNKLSNIRAREEIFRED